MMFEYDECFVVSSDMLSVVSFQYHHMRSPSLLSNEYCLKTFLKLSDEQCATDGWYNMELLVNITCIALKALPCPSLEYMYCTRHTMYSHHKHKHIFDTSHVIRHIDTRILTPNLLVKDYQNMCHETHIHPILFHTPMYSLPSLPG